MPVDTTDALQRWLASSAAAVLFFGTDLLTVRIDLGV
jgi:hypothetical protein